MLVLSRVCVRDERRAVGAAHRVASGPQREQERTCLRKGRRLERQWEAEGGLRRWERGPQQRKLLENQQEESGQQPAGNAGKEGAGQGGGAGAPCLSALPHPRPATSGIQPDPWEWQGRTPHTDKSRSIDRNIALSATERRPGIKMHQEQGTQPAPALGFQRSSGIPAELGVGEAEAPLQLPASRVNGSPDSHYKAI